MFTSKTTELTEFEEHVILFFLPLCLSVFLKNHVFYFHNSEIIFETQILNDFNFNLF